MKKSIVLLGILLSGTVLSGCSYIGVSDKETLKNANALNSSNPSEHKELSHKDSFLENLESNSNPEKESPKSLSGYKIESFPAWFDPDLYPKTNWQKITLQSSLSFSDNLSNYGVKTDWVSELRRSDYIDISTIYDGQTVWVEIDESKDVEYLYTEISPSKAYYINMTETHPVMFKGFPPLTFEGSFYLRPGTQLKDLSDIQKLVVKKYIDRILPQISYDEEVIVTMGETKITFSYDRLQSNRVGNVQIESATSWFDDYMMVYKPE